MKRKWELVRTTRYRFREDDEVVIKRGTTNQTDEQIRQWVPATLGLSTGELAKDANTRIDDLCRDDFTSTRWTVRVQKDGRWVEVGNFDASIRWGQ